jgi:hypothetical protein
MSTEVFILFSVGDDGRIMERQVDSLGNETSMLYNQRRTRTRARQSMDTQRTKTVDLRRHDARTKRLVGRVLLLLLHGAARPGDRRHRAFYTRPTTGRWVEGPGEPLIDAVCLHAVK